MVDIVEQLIVEQLIVEQLIVEQLSQLLQSKTVPHRDGGVSGG